MVVRLTATAALAVLAVLAACGDTLAPRPTMLEVGGAYALDVTHRIEYVCEPLPPPFPSPDPTRCPDAAPDLEQTDSIQATMVLEDFTDVEGEPFGSVSFSGTVQVESRICDVADDGSRSCVERQGAGTVVVQRVIVYCPEVDLIGFDLEKSQICADHSPGDTVLSVQVMVPGGDAFLTNALRFLVRGSEDGEERATGAWEFLGVDRIRLETLWSMVRRD